MSEAYTITGPIVDWDALPKLTDAQMLAADADMRDRLARHWFGRLCDNDPGCVVCFMCHERQRR